MMPMKNARSNTGEIMNEYKVIVLIEAPTAQQAKVVVEEAMADLLEQQDVDEFYDFDWQYTGVK